MGAVNHTHYNISFRNGDCLQHIDAFKMKFDDVIEGLMLLNGREREDIKQVFVTYDYEPLRCK